MLNMPSRKRNIVWNVTKYILAAALVWFVYSQTSIKDVVDLFEGVSVTWFLGSFVLFFLMTMVKAAQYYLLSGRQTLYKRVLSIVIMQNLIASFVATSAGIASYLTMFRFEENIRLRKSAETFVVSKIGDLAAVWLMLFATSILLWNRILDLRIAAIIILLAIPLAIGGFITVIILRQKFVQATHALMSYLRLDRFAVAQRGLKVLGFLAEQDGNAVLRLLPISMLCSLVYMTLALLWAYTSLRAFSTIIPASVIIFANSWIQLISWLPIQVLGGLGVMETSQVYLYSLFDIPAVRMATVSVGLRVSLYLFNLVSLLYLPIYNLVRRKGSSVGSLYERPND